MEETLKMMKSILTGKEKNQDEKELIKQYQKGLCPNILAYFYSENIGILKITNNLYPILDDEDKASFCLQEMDKCLQNYNLESRNKFITYFITCYKNRLRMETEQLLTQKRKANIICDNFDDVEVLNYDLDCDIEFILDDYNLSEKEKEHCKLAMNGYSIREIAKKFNQHFQTLYNQRAKIKEKILNGI